MSQYNLPSRLSFSDIATLDVCKGGSCSNLPFKQLLEIAFKHGLDINGGYDVEKGLHRNLQGSVINCEYIIANERMDTKWLKSGHASVEATMMSCKDRSLVSELQRVQNGGKSIEQHGKGKTQYKQ